MRLIDADAIIRDFPCAADDWSSMLIRKALDDTPTIEPKKGEWMVANTCDIKTGEIYRDSYICSACMKAYTEPSNYCPNCGADMRGGK